MLYNLKYNFFPNFTWHVLNACYFHNLLQRWLLLLLFLFKMKIAIFIGSVHNLLSKLFSNIVLAVYTIILISLFAEPFCCKVFITLVWWVILFCHQFSHSIIHKIRPFIVRITWLGLTFVIVIHLGILLSISYLCFKKKMILIREYSSFIRKK